MLTNKEGKWANKVKTKAGNLKIEKIWSMRIGCEQKNIWAAYWKLGVP